MIHSIEPAAQVQAEVLVVGGTPAGIAAAVRAARLGCSVVLTQHNQHLGGMLANGIVQWDALSNHRRCPIFDEILTRIQAHYRESFGDNSPQHQASQLRLDRHPSGLVEPGVAERILGEMVGDEARITVWLGWHVVSVQRQERCLTRATFAQHNTASRRTVTASVFVDASYEGDLVAHSGAAWRAGREAASEFDEPHAGQIFTRIAIDRRLPTSAVSGAIALHPYGSYTAAVDPNSPRTADPGVQAYNLRPCLTYDPARRVLPDKPATYDRDELLHYNRRYLWHGATSQINSTATYNAPILPGENWDYPTGDWTVRQQITQRHRDFAVSLMWFLQNDPSIPAEQQQHHREFGLCSNEFADSAHLPWEMYVREARRIVGRHVLSERDLTAGAGGGRPRVFHDAIAFTDWYMDSHSCGRDIGTYGRRSDLLGSDDFPFDGKLILTEQLAPGSIPYRSLLPRDIDNLLVPVCLSATHVAWGAVRLEPCWIHLGEVTGLAAAIAVAQRVAPASLSVDSLQRRLLDSGASIVFLNQHRDIAAHPRRPQLELAVCNGEHLGFDVPGDFAS